MTMLADVADVVIGVDTHKDTHTAAVVASATGAPVAEWTVTAKGAGYEELIGRAENVPGLRCWAIEGAGSYGAGLARFLAERGEWVVEVERPRRPARRHGAKSDAIDAVRAAREALSSAQLAAPKHGPERDVLSRLLVVRRSAVNAATDGQRQLHALLVASPEPIRARFRGLSTLQTVRRAAALRIPSRADHETRATLSVLRALARRVLALTQEAKSHEHAVLATVQAWHPELLEEPGVGPIVAATVLCAWSHPGRFASEAAFAQLAGCAPIPASSGRTVRHRLNRSGNRALNAAIHTVAITRLRRDPTTQAYAQRRRAEGKTDREIRRCLKRYIARQLYRLLEPATP
jgi:transposase